MKTFTQYLLFFIVILFLSACSYTPEEQAKFDAQRAYWNAQSGHGADSSR